MKDVVTIEDCLIRLNDIKRDLALMYAESDADEHALFRADLLIDDVCRTIYLVRGPH